VGLVVASVTVMLVGWLWGWVLLVPCLQFLITGSGSGVGSAAGGGGGGPSHCHPPCARPSSLWPSLLAVRQSPALLLWLLVVVRVRHGYRNTRGDRVTGTTGMGTVLVFGTL